MALLLTPTFLRSELMAAFLFVLVKPLEDLHYVFLQNRKEMIYRLAHNSQVCYLRAALNDRFDTQLRRIQIVEGNGFRRQYIYTDGEQKPKFLGTMYLFDDSDYEDTGVDFIVQVPTDLVFGIYEMQSLIEIYRLASKRYKVVKI
ncbi:hypothetical protein [Kaistella daneshvariae]|nr:hypothetical protein [Kaistella daneshvariae]